MFLIELEVKWVGAEGLEPSYERFTGAVTIPWSAPDTGLLNGVTKKPPWFPRVAC